MEEKQFEFRYKGPYFVDESGWTMPVEAIVGKDSKPLRQHFGRVYPEHLLLTGRSILEGREVTGHFLRCGEPDLRIYQIENEKVRIQSARGETTVTREAIAFEFFKYHNDLFHSTLTSSDTRDIEEIAQTQIEMLEDARISGLFEKYETKIHPVPQEFLIGEIK
jgi:hypothetical protein